MKASFGNCENWLQLKLMMVSFVSSCDSVWVWRVYRGKEREEGQDKEGTEEVMNKKVLFFPVKCK